MKFNTNLDCVFILLIQRLSYFSSLSLLLLLHLLHLLLLLLLSSLSITVDFIVQDSWDPLYIICMSFEWISSLFVSVYLRSELKYRVFIKYCVYSKISKYFPDSGRSRFSLGVSVCVHPDFTIGPPDGRSTISNAAELAEFGKIMF